MCCNFFVLSESSLNFSFHNSSSGQKAVQGTCGRGCEAKSGIDTIGVYEFDTTSEKVVATHVMEEGFGGDPYPSPDGSKSSTMYYGAVILSSNYYSYAIYFF